MSTTTMLNATMATASMRPEKSPMRKLPMELKVDILIKAIYSVEPRVIEVQFDLTTNEWSAVEESYVRSHLRDVSDFTRREFAQRLVFLPYKACILSPPRPAALASPIPLMSYFRPGIDTIYVTPSVEYFDYSPAASMTGLNLLCVQAPLILDGLTRLAIDCHDACTLVETRTDIVDRQNNNLTELFHLFPNLEFVDIVDNDQRTDEIDEYGRVEGEVEVVAYNDDEDMEEGVDYEELHETEKGNQRLYYYVQPAGTQRPVPEFRTAYIVRDGKMLAV